MNILFIEDERDLREVGVAQLELRQYTVYPVSSIEEARAIMLNPSTPVHLVLADHRLPDGEGVDFVIEMQAQFPECMYMIVSGCLTDDNMEMLDENEIAYYHKPLLYGKVVEEFRRARMLKASLSAPVVVSTDVEEGVEAVEGTTEGAEGAEGTDVPEVPKRKKWFGLFG